MGKSEKHKTKWRTDGVKLTTFKFRVLRKNVINKTPQRYKNLAKRL